jgi:hypothetical protein
LRRLSDNAVLCHRRGAAPASHWFEESNVARQPARAVTLDLRAASVRAARCAAAASLRKSRGKVSQPGSPLFSDHIFRGGPRSQGFAHAGNAALDRSGPPQGRLSVTRKGGC